MNKILHFRPSSLGYQPFQDHFPVPSCTDILPFFSKVHGGGQIPMNLNYYMNFYFYHIYLEVLSPLKIRILNKTHHHRTRIQHDKFITVHNSVQPMCNDKNRTIFKSSSDCLLDKLISLKIYISSGFI